MVGFEFRGVKNRFHHFWLCPGKHFGKIPCWPPLNILKIVFKVNDYTDREIQRLCRQEGTASGQVQAVEKVLMFYIELFLTTYLTCRWLCMRESLHLDQRLFSQIIISTSTTQMTTKEV